MQTGFDSEEKERVDKIYSCRNYDADIQYSDLNPIYLHRIQSIERTILAAFEITHLKHKLSTIRILDYGCGNGKWFGRWLAWGARFDNIVGVDLREKAIELARYGFPGIDFQTMSNGVVPFSDNTFDLVFQNLVFSSIIDERFRHLAASEIMRVLKPGGLIYWCDFFFNNPENRNVRAVKKKDIKLLFPGFEIVYLKKIILAPPVAKFVVPFSWLAAVMLEAVAPILRTHNFIVLKKPNLND